MSYKLALLLGMLCLATFVAAEITEEEDVAVVTDANFDEWIKDQKFALLELYAPWCGHCKKLAPEYAKAAKQLKGNDPKIPLGKVDATEQKNLATKFSVQGFPTLKFFAEGNWIDYTGGRTEKDIVAWLQKRTGQVTTEIKTAEELQKFIDSSDVALVYFGAAETDDQYKSFKSVAMGIEGLAFGHVFGHDDVRESQKAKANSVVLFKKFDEGRNDYTGSATSTEELKKFVDTYSFGIVMKFDDRAIEKVFQQGNPTIFLFSEDNKEASQAAEKAFREVATSKRGGKVLFSSSKANDGSGHFQKLADYVGVDTQKLPAIMLVHASRDINKYKFDREITADNIGKFVDEYNAGKLEVYYKSEDIPAEQKEAVQVVVGKSFKQVVLDNNKDVLVEFYAPWCGHCKQLAPKYEAAAQKLKANPNIIIAKVDATANEIPGVNIRSFPTLKFWPGNKKSSPVDYDGAREEDGIIQWIKDHTTHPWVELGSASTGETGKKDEKGHDDL